MYQLIGAPVSLYTGKVRSYLQFKGIPFTEQLATPQVYRDLIIPRTGVRYIPVLVTPQDQVLQDSTEIIDHLEQQFPEPAIYPTGPSQKLIALLLETYGDEWLVIPAMLYRWMIDENREFAIAEFGRVRLPEASAGEQYQAGLEASGPFAGALPRLGVTPHSRAALEQSYLALLAELDRHFAEHDFLLGGRPSIGDYGLIGPLYAHLYRDPASGRLMREKAPQVAAWVERMIDPPAAGGFLPDDELPPHPAAGAAAHVHRAGSCAAGDGAPAAAVGRRQSGYPGNPPRHRQPALPRGRYRGGAAGVFLQPVDVAAGAGPLRRDG
ncbi:glutathione S-transferase family protein [Halopseudomonas pertucinogena]|uniref:GST C-terminal domain-containing protein n=1 Tax=Halopseudomonas pertucinogena TaxID=86175 RepID=A0ABQ2CIY5_9GAMM|nr:glutathione S-transferase [Halopseudomonas pertucinogena]GGI90429.1 hypothetical protein GCM10009083_03480 [Halopseudomonas pertucinogena]